MDYSRRPGFVFILHVWFQKNTNLYVWSWVWGLDRKTQSEPTTEIPSFQGVPSIFMHINVKTCPKGRVGTLRVKHQVSESFVHHEDRRGSSMRRPLRCDTHDSSNRNVKQNKRLVLLQVGQWSSSEHHDSHQKRSKLQSVIVGTLVNEEEEFKTSSCKKLKRKDWIQGTAESNVYKHVRTSWTTRLRHTALCSDSRETINNVQRLWLAAVWSIDYSWHILKILCFASF